MCYFPLVAAATVERFCCVFNSIEPSRVAAWGGFPIMSAYTEHIKSKQWQNLSKLCRLVARNRCQMCGSSDGVMHSHHMSYERMTKEDEALDLCVLCESCHVIYHRKHKYPPIKNANRSKRLDDLSTVLATHGVDVSYFHKNRILVDGGWEKSVMTTTEEKRAVQGTRKQNAHFIYEKVTPEIIEIAKCPKNIHGFMCVFNMKSPLQDGWENKVMGKDIRIKTVNRFRKVKKSWDQSQAAKRRNNKRKAASTL